MITPGQSFSPVVGVPFTAPVLTSIPHSGFLAETPEYIGIDPSTGVLSGTLSKIYSGNAKVSYQSSWADLFIVIPPHCNTPGSEYCYRVLGVTTDGVVLSCSVYAAGAYAYTDPRIAQSMVAYGDFVQVCQFTVGDYPHSRSNAIALKSNGTVETLPGYNSEPFPNLPTGTVTKIGVRGTHYNQVFYGLRSSGVVYEWNRTSFGDADYGVVGGVTVNSNVRKIATNYGDGDQWAIEKTDGSVYSNISGSPALITGIGGTVAELAVGSYQLLIRKTDGTAFVLNPGAGGFPSAGLGSTIVYVSSIGSNSAVVFSDGQILTWDNSIASGLYHSWGGQQKKGSGNAKALASPYGTYLIKTTGQAQWGGGNFLNEARSLFFPRPYASISFGGVGGAPDINVGNVVIPARQEFEFQCSVGDQRATPASNWNATGLPDGLTISPEGLISGIPTSVGTFNPTISALGGDGSSASVVFTFRIVGGLAVIPPNQTIAGRVGVALATSLALDSISAPPLYFKAIGKPFWLTIEDDGTLTGTPNKVGSFSLEVTVFSVFGSSTETVNFDIQAGIPEVDPAQKIDAWLDFDLSYYPRLKDPQNSPSTSWSATGLPSGAAISATTGEITWRPTSVTAPVSVAITVSGGGSSTTTTLQLRVLKSAYIYRGNKNLQMVSHQRQASDSGLSVVSAEYICPTPNAQSAARLLQARLPLPNFPDHISKDSASQNIDSAGFAKFSITGFSGRKNISVPVDVPTVFGTQLSSVTMTLNRGPNAEPVGYTLRILSDTITKKFTIAETTSMTEIGLPSEAIKFEVYEITNNTTSVSYSSFAEFLQIFAPTFDQGVGGTNRSYTTINPAPETALASLAQLVSLSRANYGEIDEVTATWGLAFSAFEIKAIRRTEFIPF
jgi:hypothetical protein